MNCSEMIEHLKNAGFKNTEDLVHLFLGGSSQHGAAIPGKVSDIDIYGVYLEPPAKALGVSEETHFTGSTQDQYVRNRPGDEDYKCYTLQRWAGLACKGNPTVLGFLYTPCAVPGVWADYILPASGLFKARSHAKAFLGYAQGQVARLKGVGQGVIIGGEHIAPKGQGKHGQRPELELQFGYDTKAGMHLIRLMYEAWEYMRTGHITYPRPEKDLLLAIRQGCWSMDRLLTEYGALEMVVKKAMEDSKLPDQVDREKVSQLISQAYLWHWKRQGYLNQCWQDIVLKCEEL